MEYAYKEWRTKKKKKKRASGHRPQTTFFSLTLSRALCSIQLLRHVLRPPSFISRFYSRIFVCSSLFYFFSLCICPSYLYTFSFLFFSFLFFFSFPSVPCTLHSRTFFFFFYFAANSAQVLKRYFTRICMLARDKDYLVFFFRCA